MTVNGSQVRASPVLRALALTATAALVSCGDDPLSPADQLSVRVDSQHLIYRMSPGDQVDTAWMESYWRWLTAQLGVPPQKLEYHKYRDRAHMKRVTDRTTNGFAEPGTTRFHTVWPIDNHEIVHVVAIMLIGHPPALFNEGLAVAHQALPADGILYPQWNRLHIHDIAKSQLAANVIPPVEALLASTDFFRYNAEAVYPMAGSFVRWLIDQYGLETFRAFVSGATFNQLPATTSARFEAVYGIPIGIGWNRWKAFLHFREAT